MFNQSDKNKCIVEYPEEMPSRYSSSVLNDPQNKSRRFINNVKKKYYPFIGLIQAYNNKDTSLSETKEKISTGVLIAPNLVLTAAHCIFFDNEDRADHVTFIPHINQKCIDLNEEITVDMSKTEIYPEYFRKKFTAAYDIAVLVLSKRVEIVNDEYPCCEPLNGIRLTKIHVDIVGYPEEYLQNKEVDDTENKENKMTNLEEEYTYKLSNQSQSTQTRTTQSQNNQKRLLCPNMKGQYGIIKSVKPDIIKYQIKTSNGQSGSPIIFKNRKTKKTIIIGVHCQTFSGENIGCRISKEKSKWIDEIKFRCGDFPFKIKSQDENEAIQIGIEMIKKYSINCNISDFIRLTDSILSEINEIVCNTKGKKGSTVDFWIIKYFNLCSEMTYLKPDSKTKFQTFNTEKAKSFLKDCPWYILRKILQTPKIFDDNFVEEHKKLFSSKIQESLENEINLALEYLFWREKVDSTLTQTINFTREILEKMKKITWKNEKIIEGKIEKSHEIPFSIIFGEDGGCYLLINSVEFEKDISISVFLENNINEDYLSMKITSKPNGKEKIVIGQGGFGKVRFALSLFNPKKINGVCPGDLICIKKIKKRGDNQKIIDIAFQDYFMSSNHILNQAIYSPPVYDMALTNCDQILRGYVMMKIIPQHTGYDLFIKKNRKINLGFWNLYQKPYILEIMRKIEKLLAFKIAPIDLKPSNTLFDPVTKKGYLIDLGSRYCIKDCVECQEIKGLELSGLPYSKEYLAPELVECINFPEYLSKINFTKALSYPCGKILDELVNVGDNQEVKDKLIDVIKRLTFKSLYFSDIEKDRISISDAIIEISKIGDDDHLFQESITAYIENLNKNIVRDTNLNEQFIPIYASKMDYTRHQTFEAGEVSGLLDEFFNKDPLSSGLLVLFGNTGSGKSTAIKNRFISAIRDWKLKETNLIPIYINLANTYDFDEAIELIDLDLGTNLKKILFEFKDSQKIGIHLYLDNFDEKTENIDSKDLMQKYFNKLNLPFVISLKVLVACKIDEDIDLDWFKPKTEKIQVKLETLYILPFHYLEKDNLKNSIETFKQNNNYPEISKDRCFEKIIGLNLKEIMSTVLNFKIIMYLIDDLRKNSFSEYDLYHNYTSKLIQYKIKNAQNHHMEINSLVLNKICKYIAVWLFVQERNYIENTEEFYEFLKFILDEMEISHNYFISFYHQEFYQVLKLCPLKLEITKGNKKIKLFQEKIRISFLHNTIKNYYVLNSIFSELNITKAYSKIICSRSIVNDAEFIKFVANYIEIYSQGNNEDSKGSKDLKDYLWDHILWTRENNTEEAIIGAANAITILVAAKQSFANKDLSKVNIRGSNLQNGIFYYANLSSAVLTNSNAKSINLWRANLMKTNIIGLKFGIKPSLINHIDGYSTYVSYSPEGNQIAISYSEKTWKLWDAKTFKVILTRRISNSKISAITFSPLGNMIACVDEKYIYIYKDYSPKMKINHGHDQTVIKINFSPNGELLATCSFGCNIIKLWTVSREADLNFKQELEGHLGPVTSIEFSNTEDTLLSSSYDGSCRIWKIYENNVPSRIYSETMSITSAAFCPNGKNFATGSKDNTVKIIGSLEFDLKFQLVGHKDEVKKVAYSPNGSFLASISKDNTCIVWNPLNGQIIELFASTTKIVNFAISPDNRHICACIRTDCKIWVVSGSKEIQKMQGHFTPIKKVAWNLNSEYLATASVDGMIKIWNCANWREVTNFFRIDAILVDIAFSPCEKYEIIIAYEDMFRIFTFPQKKLTLEVGEPGITSISYSNDGRFVVTSSVLNSCKVWSRTGTALLNFSEGEHDIDTKILSVCFCPRKEILASCCDDSHLILWDYSGKIIDKRELKFKLLSLHFSPDGKNLVGRSEHHLFFYNFKKDYLLNNEEILEKCYPRCFTYSSDGKQMSFGTRYKGDDICIILKADSNDVQFNLESHTRYITTIAFSPNSSLIATGSEDCTVKIWSNSSPPNIIYEICGSERPINLKYANFDYANLSNDNYEILKNEGANINKDSIETLDIMNMGRENIIKSTPNIKAVLNAIENI